MTGIRDMSLIRTVSAAGEEASPRGDPRAPQVCGRRAAMNSIVSTEPCGSLLSSPQGTHPPELFQTPGSASAPTPENGPEQFADGAVVGAGRRSGVHPAVTLRIVTTVLPSFGISCTARAKRQGSFPSPSRRTEGQVPGRTRPCPRPP
jgi:hypothetical protein